jgi:hypothetical protein
VLYAIGLDKIAVVASDVFFVDPDPGLDQHGAEAGVRVELRTLERLPLQGSIYSAQPISVQRPLARIDLFETFPGGRGRNDRVHYHPRCVGWEPGERHFDPELSAEPLVWLAKQLSDTSGLLEIEDQFGAQALSERRDEIVDAVDRIWSEVRSGRLDPPPGWTREESVRFGWL